MEHWKKVLAIWWGLCSAFLVERLLFVGDCLYSTPGYQNPKGTFWNVPSALEASCGSQMFFGHQGALSLSGEKCSLCPPGYRNQGAGPSGMHSLWRVLEEGWASYAYKFMKHFASEFPLWGYSGVCISTKICFLISRTWVQHCSGRAGSTSDIFRIISDYPILPGDIVLYKYTLRVILPSDGYFFPESLIIDYPPNSRMVLETFPIAPQRC